MKTSRILMLLICVIFTGSCAAVSNLTSPLLEPVFGKWESLYRTGQYEEYIRFEYGPDGIFSSSEKGNDIISKNIKLINLNQDIDAFGLIRYFLGLRHLVHSFIETRQFDKASSICDKGIKECEILRELLHQHNKNEPYDVNDTQVSLYIYKAYIEWFKTGDKEKANNFFRLAEKTRQDTMNQPMRVDFIGNPNKLSDQLSNIIAYEATKLIDKVLISPAMNFLTNYDQKQKIYLFFDIACYEQKIMGDYEKSLKYLEEIISLAQSMSILDVDTKYAVLLEAYRRKMIINIHLGQLEAAKIVLEDYDKIVNKTIFKAGASLLKDTNIFKGYISQMYSTAGALLSLSRDFNQSKEYFDKAFDMIKNIEPTSPDINDQNALATYHVYYGIYFLGLQKRYSEALNSVNTGLSHLKPYYISAIKNDLDIETGYLYSCEINHSAKNFDKAISDAKTAIELSKRYHNKIAMANAHALIGKIYLEQYKTKYAKQELETAESLLKNVEKTENWELFYDLGKMYESQKNDKKALSYYKKAVENVEKLWSGRFKDVGRQMLFIEDRLVVFEPVIRLLTKQNKFDDAVEYIEKSKSRSFYESSSSGIADGENKQWQNIKPLSGSEIKKMLPSNVAILEYYVGKETVVGAVITNKNISLKNLSVKPEDLERYVFDFRKTIELKTTELNDNSDDYIAKSGTAGGGMLYNSLIKPFEKELSKHKQICIIPHGVLHYLPFHALTKNKGFFIENYIVSYAPSATILNIVRKNNKKQINSLLAAGSPPSAKKEDLGIDMARKICDDSFVKLDAAQEEMDKVSNLFTDKAKFSDKDATETIVKSNIENYDFLLFSTHGFLIGQNPLESFLLFNKDKSNDGLLTVMEIEKMKLKANMVVLSACQSGLMTGYSGNGGKCSSDTNNIDFPLGDDLFGLQRAFMKVGVSSVLSTLWSVNANKSEMFVTKFFEEYVKNGKSKITALHNAQLYMVKDANLHPFFWSPFILSGDWE